MTDELIEVLDNDGFVTGVSPRSQVRSRNLWHRTAAVVVRSSAGAVLAHQRAFTKWLGPGTWDLAFGGACDVGESWHDAAARELYEEAGISTPLRKLGTYRWHGKHSREMGRLYETTSDGSFFHLADEVTTSQFVTLTELDAFLAEHEVLETSWIMVLRSHLR